MTDKRISWQVRDLGDGDCEVVLGFELSPYPSEETAAVLGWGWKSLRRAAKRAYKKTKKLAVMAIKGSMAGALFKAATAAAELANNPVLAAMMPPGTAKALQTAIKLSRAAQEGRLSQVLKTIKGKGARRLAKQLRKYDKGCRK